MARIQICKVNISRLLRDKLVYFINKIRGEVLCLLKTFVTIPFISLGGTEKLHMYLEGDEIINATIFTTSS